VQQVFDTDNDYEGPPGSSPGGCCEAGSTGAVPAALFALVIGGVLVLPRRRRQ
jgi:MYXO-CTERM domain-containing protein